MFKVNQTLKQVNLSENEIGSVGAWVVSMILESNNSLTELNLSDAHIEDLGAGHLARALTINKTLTKIDLTANLITQVSCPTLFRAIAINEALTTISLKNNLINSATKNIAEMLKVNKTLTNVNLSHCSIGKDDISYLAEALEVNTTLLVLDLRWNTISKLGAIYLAPALKLNQTLREIDLSNCYLEKAGIQTITKALKLNYSLISVNLSDLLIFPELLKPAEDYINRNKKILQMLPNHQREHISHTILSQILPNNVPDVVTGIIREYDGTESIITRIIEKVDSKEDQTLDKIMSENNLSSVLDSQAFTTSSNSSSSSFPPSEFQNNAEQFTDPIIERLIRESEQKAEENEESELSAAVKANLERGVEENLIIHLLQTHGAKAHTPNSKPSTSPKNARVENQGKVMDRQ